MKQNADFPTSSAEGRRPEPSKKLAFDLQTAKGMQEADRFKTAEGVFLFLSAVAALGLYIVGIDSLDAFSDWLRWNNWTENHLEQNIVVWASFAALAVLSIFIFPGTMSLYAGKPNKIIRRVFLFSWAILLLPPLFLRRTVSAGLMEGFALLYFLSRWFAVWAKNQRPRDWKVIVAEKRRLNWGALEFATALTKGHASDGGVLAFVSDEEDHSFGRMKEAAPAIRYERSISILTLTLKQKYPYSNTDQNWQTLIAMLEFEGCTPAEHEQLSRTWLFVHPEIADRISAFIDP